MGFLDDIFKKYKKNNSAALTVEDISKLPTFADVDLGLYWNRVTKDNLSENEQYFQEMATWAQDKNIQKYISYSVPIDQLFRSFILDNRGSKDYDDRCNLYFCFNDNKDLIGATYVTAPIGLNTDSTIEYIVVNPKFQKAGIGTKMIKSISSFNKYFNNGYQSDGFYASVNTENVASSRALLKNNYKVVSTNWTDLGKHYTVLYLSSRDMVAQGRSLEQ